MHISLIYLTLLHSRNNWSRESGESLEQVLDIDRRAGLKLAGVSAYDSKLDVLLGNLLLHDALQGAENQLLCLCESHIRVILLLDVGHSCLTTGADGTCLPLQEGARGVSLI